MVDRLVKIEIQTSERVKRNVKVPYFNTKVEQKLRDQHSVEVSRRETLSAERRDTHSVE